MTCTVVIPTYNEAENLPALVGALFALPLDGLRIVVVDDASPDGTGQIAAALQAHHPDRLWVVQRPAKLGLGSAYLTGFRRALDMGSEAIVQMDADGSHNPHDIPRLLARLADRDVVIGSRYVGGGEVDRRWSWWRRFLSWWANAVYSRLILGMRTHDTTAGFKAWRRKALQLVMEQGIHSSGYVFQVETAYVAERLGLRALEVPIYFEDRRIGRSKMSVPIKLEAAWRVWEIRRRHGHIRRQTASGEARADAEPAADHPR